MRRLDTARKGQGMILIVGLSLGGPGDAETGDRLMVSRGLGVSDVCRVGGYLTIEACFPYWVKWRCSVPCSLSTLISSHLT